MTTNVASVLGACVAIVVVAVAVALAVAPTVHSEGGKPCILVASSLLAVAPHQVPSEILLPPKKVYESSLCSADSYH